MNRSLKIPKFGCFKVVDIPKMCTLGKNYSLVVTSGQTTSGGDIYQLYHC